MHSVSPVIHDRARRHSAVGAMAALEVAVELLLTQTAFSSRSLYVSTFCPNWLLLIVPANAKGTAAAGERRSQPVYEERHRGRVKGGGQVQAQALGRDPTLTPAPATYPTARNFHSAPKPLLHYTRPGPNL